MFVRVEGGGGKGREGRNAWLTIQCTEGKVKVSAVSGWIAPARLSHHAAVGTRCISLVAWSTSQEAASVRQKSLPVSLLTIQTVGVKYLPNQVLQLGEPAPHKWICFSQCPQFTCIQTAVFLLLTFFFGRPSRPALQTNTPPDDRTDKSARSASTFA